MPPDPALLAFGSSLDDDLVLAPFDVLTSHAHVDALAGGAIIGDDCAIALHRALAQVEREIEDGSFPSFARATRAEDVHGAIDARVRELEPEAGAWLHAGRSRNDQVATTLALYARNRSQRGAQLCESIARGLCERADVELAEGSVLAATTHWQPAQPVLLAFWLCAAAEPLVRATRRFRDAAASAARWCSLGSAALAGSTLPLDREASCARLGFDRPSRNAMDAVGSRDCAIDAAHAFVRAVADCSRIAAEVIVWATPAYGYARLGDASSTGSSLMPQKRNPDTFELVRGGASELAGMYSGALASIVGLPLSYHRDLQQTKRLCVLVCERGAAMLDAFERALRDTVFSRDTMRAAAEEGYTVATDVADALILRGCSAREAHALVGGAVAAAEAQARSLRAADLGALAVRAGIAQLEAPLTADASVRAKVTAGSTSPSAVREALTSLMNELSV